MHVWNGLLKVTNIVMETSWPSPVQMSTGTCTTLEDFQKKSLRIISTTGECYCEIEDRKKTLWQEENISDIMSLARAGIESLGPKHFFWDYLYLLMASIAVNVIWLQGSQKRACSSSWSQTSSQWHLSSKSKSQVQMSYNGQWLYDQTRRSKTRRTRECHTLLYHTVFWGKCNHCFSNIK